MNPDVVIVGGGIMGAATFWELSRRGCPTLLLERKTFSAESTGKSAAVVRMHYSNAVTVRMALKSRRDFIELPSALNCDRFYDPAGWLFIVDQESAKTARQNLAMQTEEGSDGIEVDLGQVEEMVPGIDMRGIACAIYEEQSGYADPVGITRAYLRAAESERGIAREHATVNEIAIASGKVVGVIADGQKIHCDCVVLAAGAWSGLLSATAGIDLPLEITREQDVIYRPNGATPFKVALSDQVDRIYLRPFDELGERGILVGRGFPKDYELVDPEGYDSTVDEAFEEDIRTRATARIPTLEGMRMKGSRVGLYTVTPDWHPILGAIESVAGLFVATGGSGHCFKLGPAIGEMVAGAILDFDVPYADIDLFAPERFARGRPFGGTFGGNRA